LAGEKAASSGAGLAQTREAGTGRSELAKTMAVGRAAVSIGLTLEAAAAARKGWRLLERRGDWRGQRRDQEGPWKRRPTGTGGRTGGGGGRIPGSRTVAHEGCGVDG